MNHDEDHSMHDMQEPATDKSLEYFKFGTIIFIIFMLSYIFWSNTNLAFLDSFMGVFFVVFALFKLKNYKEFAYGFQSYDVVARRSLAYSYAYPILQLVFGVAYLAGYGSLLLDSVVVLISLVSGAGVLQALSKKSKIHCVCLGGVIKLPLSSISFVEDFGMALMALAMIFMR